MAKGACRPCDLLIVAVLLAGVFETATAARLIHDELSVQSTRADSARGLRSQAADPLDAVLSDYLSNAQLVAHLDDYTKRCGNISRVLKIGESVDGVPLLALEISDQPGKEEAEPNLKLIAGIHGNEPLGRVVTVALAEWLCANYHTNSTAARIVRDAHLWILPAMNPDGFALGTRENANQADLNRNFPDHYSTPPFTTKGLTFQPETQAVMSWVTSRHFVSSISYHGGALVANYPWDATPDGSVRYDASPDDKTFKYLATTYAKAHPGMVGPENSEFPTGITNGAAWYPVYGGMQDWNYVVAKCMELTLEIGVDKWPPASTLPKAFADNKEAVLKYLDATAFGG